MKIVTAVNAMISRPELISDVVVGRGANEIFFLYAERFKWSVLESSEGSSVFLYTGSESIAELAEVDSDRYPEAWEHIQFVRYSARDIGTKEAAATFSDLIKIVKEKQHGVEDVLDEIIKTADWTQSN